MAYLQTIKDLENHLEEQLQFIERSCNAFDGGYTDEAKRMAHAMRILFHDSENNNSGASSKSILTQLGIKLIRKYLSTTLPNNESSVLTYIGLASISSNVQGKSVYSPFYDGFYSYRKFIDFEEYWDKEIIIRDNKKRNFTRKNLVMFIANKYGGSHVDPKITEKYADLIKGNSMGFISQDDEPIEEIDLATLRQIAHEILITFRVKYNFNEPQKDLVTANLVMVLDSSISTDIKFTSNKIGRNDPCPCGVGKKWKKCHGE